MGREGVADHGVRVRFTACRVFEQTKIYVFMFCIMSYIMQAVSVVVVSLMRLQACVGSVCGGVTALMCLGRDVHGWVRRFDAYITQHLPQHSPYSPPW